MPVCYFNNDFDHKYKCQYNICDDYLDVSVEYDIENEGEPINGVRYFPNDT